MGALVCDICGGKLVMGSGGIATCESCGMEHSQDRMKEKIQEIKGVVRVDNSHMVDNWMKMGTAAADAGNNKEAYEYFTKVIEVDPENWRAIYEKGKAGAWQSTLGNLRISEIYQGIQMALAIINRDGLPEEELISVKNEFAVALYNINNAITDLMEDNLNSKDNLYFDTHWDAMWDTRARFITNVSQIEDAISLIADLDDDLSKSNVIVMKKRMCTDLKKACKSTQYWDDYSQSSLSYFGFKANEKKEYLDKFWQLVDEIREVEPDFPTDIYAYPDPFGPGLHMGKEISEYWKKTDDVRKAQKAAQVKERRKKEYWEKHADEKKQYLDRLEAIQQEKGKLQAVVAEYDGKISEVQGYQKAQTSDVEKELNDLKGKIRSLEEEKSKLGVFAGKQKKELQSQIDALKMGLPNIEDKFNRQKQAAQADANTKIAAINSEKKPYADKLYALVQEENSINVELTKDR